MLKLSLTMIYRRIAGKILFIINFVSFCIRSRHFNLFKCKNIKRAGNGLSVTLIVDNNFVVKIKNAMREKNAIEHYNLKYIDKIQYPLDKFKFEFEVLQRLKKISLGPEPLEYSNSYLLMEYVHCSKSFMEFSDIDNDQILEILSKIGLLHDNDIFHPDLNLGNILYTPDERILFIDFEYQYLSDVPKCEKVLYDFAIFCYKLYKFKRGAWDNSKVVIFNYLFDKGIDIKEFILLNKKYFDDGFCNDIR